MAAWQLGAFGSGGGPLQQLRHRLGNGPSTPPSPAPAAPGRPSPASTPPRAGSPAVPGPASPTAQAPRPEPARGAAPSGEPRLVAAVASPAPPALAASLAVAPLPARFAVELGPYLAAGEAERVERELAQAGYPSARFRQPTDASLYGVLLERLPAGRDPKAVVATLRQQGFADASVARHDPPAVRLGEPSALRGAVELAERARALGHPVRVAAEPGEAIAYTLRHGTFGSRPEAEAKAREFGRLGLSPQVIQVR
jgi:hypothetical protein